MSRTRTGIGGPLHRLGALMSITGALGLVAMALVAAAPVSAQSVPTTGTLYLTCYANQGTARSNCTTGSDVQKVTYTYSGSSMTMGTPSAVANTQGADGIQFLPNGDLVVAGQQSGTVSEITPGGTLVKQVASGVPEVDHISVAPQGPGGGPYITAGGYEAHGLALIPIGTNGEIEPGISCTLYNSSAPTTPISSTGFVMDTVVWDGAQAYYTESLPQGPGGLYGGYGAFGAISISYSQSAGTCSAQLTQLLTGLPSAHGMAFDPATNSILTFGSQMIAQIGVTAASGKTPMSARPISEITFGGESCWDVSAADCLKETGSDGNAANDQFDQGAVDGYGHLFVSNNNGNLVFVDYSQATDHLISQASYVYDGFLTQSLDDVAPLAGPGGPVEVNTVPEPMTAGPGQPLSDSVQVINPDTYWPAGDQAPYVQFWLNGPNDPTCQAGSATINSVWIPYTSSSGTIAWTPSPQYPANDLTTTPNTTATTWNPAWDSMPGTYRWVVDYYYWDVAKGKMVMIEGGCNAEEVTINTSVGTTATPTMGLVGTKFSDTATIANPPAAALNPQVTFTLYQGTSCNATENPAYYTSPAEAVVNGMASSPTTTVDVAGPYEWIATLSWGMGKGQLSVTSVCGSEPVTVMASPAITTTPQGDNVETSTSPSPTHYEAPFDTSVSDQATVTGGYDMTGQTISFALYDNANCTGTPTFTSTGTINQSGVADSQPYVVNQAGTWEWTASYAGDQYNAPASSSCGQEALTVFPASPTITTVTEPGAQVVVGTMIRDEAQVSNAMNGAANSASGQVLFTLFGPKDISCTITANQPLHEKVANLTVGQPDSVAYSDQYRVTRIGTYNWVDTYLGDSNDVGGATSGCGNEPVQVIKATPTITTTPEPGSSAVVGTAISDQAELTGGFRPGNGKAKVTFELFKNSSDCSTDPVFISQNSVDAMGDATSGTYTPTAAGDTYYWMDTYSGNGLNNKVVSQCGEPITITKMQPSIATTPMTPITTGANNQVGDTAVLSNFYGNSAANADNGSVEFDLFSTATCSMNEGASTLVTTMSAPVELDTSTGQYQASFMQSLTAPLVPGNYYWVALYTGNGDNLTVSSNCGEQTTVVANSSDSMTTTQTPSSGTVGAPVSDMATITGLVENTTSVPTSDTATFWIVNSCPSAPNTAPSAADIVDSLGSSVVDFMLGSDGTSYIGTASSPTPNFVPTTAGTYYWAVSFSGDTFNSGISYQCGEPVVLGAVTPTITTTASVGGTVGTAVMDSATIMGLYNPMPTDQVNFSLYTGASCAADTLVTNVGSVNIGEMTQVDGVPTWTVNSPAPNYTPSIAETYYWGVTFMPAAGDPNNATVSYCNESVTITPASGTHGVHTGGGSGGVLGASTTSSPNTGADLFLPGLLAAIALLLGGMLLMVGTSLRRRRSV